MVLSQVQEDGGAKTQALKEAGKIELNVLLFVLSNPAAPAVVEWLCNSLCGLCEQVEESSGDVELAGRILSGKALNWALVEQGPAAGPHSLQQELCKSKAWRCKNRGVTLHFLTCFSQGNIFLYLVNLAMFFPFRDNCFEFQPI